MRFMDSRYSCILDSDLASSSFLVASMILRRDFMSIPLYLMRFLCSSIVSRSSSCDILCVTVFSSNVASWRLLFIIVSSIVWFPWRKQGLLRGVWLLFFGEFFDFVIC